MSESKDITPAFTLTPQPISREDERSAKRRAKRNAYDKARNATPERRAKQRARQATPEQKEKQRARQATPEQKEKQRAKAKDRYKANREQVLLKRRARQATPEQKEKQRAKAKDRYKANREQVLLKRRAYREANRELLSAKGKDKRKADREANLDRVKEKRKAKYKANREQVLLKQRAYREANRELLSAKQKAYCEANPEEIRSRRSVSSRRRKYGLTQNQYDDMVRGCNGKCPCCKTPFTELWNDWPCVDHSHVSGCVRGILCRQCNLTIGHALDDPAILLACARYLERHARSDRDSEASQATG